MAEVDKLIVVLAGLAALLIVTAYFTGFTTDASTLGGIAGNLGDIFSGRNSSGNFAGYPSGSGGGGTGGTTKPE
jgi:hypothetical protein